MNISSNKIKHNNWRIIFGVWLIYFSFGFCIGSMSPLVHFITNDLSISYKKMGIILGSWQFVYILCAIPAGHILDKFSYKKCLLIASIIMSLSLLCRSLSIDFHQILLAVSLFGLGGSIISVGIPKIANTYFTGKSKMIIMGILMTGPALGSVICLTITSLIFLPIYNDNWRSILFIYSFLPLICGLTWIILNINKSDIKIQNETFSIREQINTINLFIKNKRIFLILILAISAFYLNHGIGNWLPKILISKGISISSASLLAAIPIFIGIFSALILPRFAIAKRRFYILIYLFLNAIFALILLQNTSLIYLLAGLVFLGITTGSLIVILLTHLTDTNIINKKQSGLSGGLFFTMAEIGGILGPFSIGLIYDYTNDFNNALYFFSIVFLCMLIPLLLLRKLD